MELYFNELSLSGQYFDQTTFANAVTVITEIFAEVKERNLSAYKNDMVFLSRKALKDELFSASFNRLNNDVKIAFRNNLLNKTNPKDWLNEQQHSSSDIFECRVINDFVTNTSLAEVAERNLQSPTVPRVLINFLHSVFAGETDIEVFKNEEESPITLNCLETRQQFLSWIGETISPPESYLSNDQLFEKTSYLSIKCNTVIYRHRHTGNFWYFDNFHRNHFEVFSANKIHKGEADLNGNLQPDTANPKKNGKLPF